VFTYVICVHYVTIATLSSISRSSAIFIYILRHLFIYQRLKLGYPTHCCNCLATSFFTSRDRLGQGRPPSLRYTPFVHISDVKVGLSAMLSFIIKSPVIFVYITWPPKLDHQPNCIPKLDHPTSLFTSRDRRRQCRLSSFFTCDITRSLTAPPCSFTSRDWDVIGSVVGGSIPGWYLFVSTNYPSTEHVFVLPAEALGNFIQNLGRRLF